MQRYFIDSSFEEIAFTSEQIFHMQKVLRMKSGDEVEVVFKKQGYIITINSFNPFSYVIKEKIDYSSELNVELTLLYCLPKGDKLEFVIQKATEIGVKRIILVQSSRCVSKYKKEDFIRKLPRFNKIALEASEQSHRFDVPVIEDLINFKQIKDYKFDYSYIAYENEKNIRFDEELKKVNAGDKIAIIIGSEGGFSQDEVDYALRCGYTPISLGKRILRSETACVYSLSVISYLLEDVK